MEAAHSHLRLIDVRTGETIEVEQGCPQCAYLQDQLDGAERDIRGWRARYMDLKRDKEADARRNPLWPTAIRLFRLWKSLTGSKRSEFGHDRFDQCEAFLKKHGAELCVRAIVGGVYDPFVTTRRNGSRKPHWGWELIFRNADKTEEFANRAPKDWRERATEAGWEFEGEAG